MIIVVRDGRQSNLKKGRELGDKTRKSVEGKKSKKSCISAENNLANSE